MAYIPPGGAFDVTVTIVHIYIYIYIYIYVYIYIYIYLINEIHSPNIPMRAGRFI